MPAGFLNRVDAVLCPRRPAGPCQGHVLRSELGQEQSAGTEAVGIISPMVSIVAARAHFAPIVTLLSLPPASPASNCRSCQNTMIVLR